MFTTIYDRACVIVREPIDRVRLLRTIVSALSKAKVGNERGVFALEFAGAYWRVHLAEDVELIERREYDEYQVPDHQDHTVSSVQFPAVQMCRHY